MHERETGFGIAVQEAIVAHASEAFGQDVLEDEPPEFVAVKGARTGAAGAGFEVFESDLPVVISDDVLCADDAAIEIGGQGL